MHDMRPNETPLETQGFEKEHLPNLTGTVHAWRPKGSLTRGGKRNKVAADYEAWTPDA